LDCVTPDEGVGTEDSTNILWLRELEDRLATKDDGTGKVVNSK
jgi:hypothetical protein